MHWFVFSNSSSIPIAMKSGFWMPETTVVVACGCIAFVLIAALAIRDRGIGNAGHVLPIIPAFQRVVHSSLSRVSRHKGIMFLVQNMRSNQCQRYELDGLVNCGFLKKSFSLVVAEFGSGMADAKGYCHAVFDEGLSNY